MKVYLAGDLNLTEWKEKLKEKLPFTFLDPSVSKEKDKDVVYSDLAMILESDLVITNLEKLSIGTICEICYAYQFHKNIFVFGFKGDSPWLRVHATKIFGNLDDVIDCLKGDINE